MADIHVQKRSGPGVWPFVVGALALVLVIWAIVEYTGSDAEQTAAPPAAEQQQWETQPGVAPDPYAPGDPAIDPPGTTPGATDPATQGTLPGAHPGTVPDEPGAAGRDPTGTGG
jgi:hypothetical protein